VTDNHENEGGDALDMRVIQDLRDLGGEDDPGLLFELVGMFLTDAPQRIREIETSLANGDVKTLERAAHTLKSSCANIGAPKLSEICKKIEEIARTRSTDGIAPLLSAAQGNYGQVEIALKQLAS